MSSIAIRNLPHSRELDRAALQAVRGGAGPGSPTINVEVPISISQQNNLVQNTNVLNNSIIGPGAWLPGLEIRPVQIGMNSLALPRSMV